MVHRSHTLRLAAAAVVLALLLGLSGAHRVSAADTVVGVEELAPRIECVTYGSRAIHRDVPFCVVLPEGYSKDRADWPVLYLLHGRGRHHRSLIDHEPARQHLLAANFVIVLPRGEDGWYIDSPVRQEDRFAIVLSETVAVAESHYQLTRDPRRRGICGWSMGGYGCVHFAVTHPGEFGFVAPIIGLLDFPRTGLPEGQSYHVPVGRFGTDPQVWSKLNPLHQAERLRGASIMLITADAAFDRSMNENFHQELQRLGIEHQWTVLAGGHTFPVVCDALPLVVKGMSNTLAEVIAP